MLKHSFSGGSELRELSVSPCKLAQGTSRGLVGWLVGCSLVRSVCADTGLGEGLRSRLRLRDRLRDRRRRIARLRTRSRRRIARSRRRRRIARSRSRRRVVERCDRPLAARAATELVPVAADAVRAEPLGVIHGVDAKCRLVTALPAAGRGRLAARRWVPPPARVAVCVRGGGLAVPWLSHGGGVAAGLARPAGGRLRRPEGRRVSRVSRCRERGTRGPLRRCRPGRCPESRCRRRCRRRPESRLWGRCREGTRAGHADVCRECGDLGALLGELVGDRLQAGLEAGRDLSTEAGRCRRTSLRHVGDSAHELVVLRKAVVDHAAPVRAEELHQGLERQRSVGIDQLQPPSVRRLDAVAPPEDVGSCRQDITPAFKGGVDHLPKLRRDPAVLGKVSGREGPNRPVVFLVRQDDRLCEHGKDLVLELGSVGLLRSREDPRLELHEDAGQGFGICKDACDERVDLLDDDTCGVSGGGCSGRGRNRVEVAFKFC